VAANGDWPLPFRRIRIHPPPEPGQIAGQADRLHQRSQRMRGGMGIEERRYAVTGFVDRGVPSAVLVGGQRSAGFTVPVA
jgi:hypothetical protein